MSFKIRHFVFLIWGISLIVDTYSSGSNSYKPPLNPQNSDPYYRPYWWHKQGHQDETDSRPGSRAIQYARKFIEKYGRSSNRDDPTYKEKYQKYVHDDYTEQPRYPDPHQNQGQIEDPHVVKVMPNRPLRSNQGAANINTQQQRDQQQNGISATNRDAATPSSNGCRFMDQMNQHGPVGRFFMDMTCTMFRRFGEDMHGNPSWEATPAQTRWFRSLGSRPQGISQRNPVHRGEKALRKEYRLLTDEERYRLHRAMNILKDTYMDGMSLYDVIARHHDPSLAPGAHYGPAFLGFHREYLLRFENALKEIDRSVSLPYWDSNLDYVLGDDLARSSVLWSDYFFGNGFGDVTTGPFAYWTLPVVSGTSANQLLNRNLTVAPTGSRTPPALMSDEALLSILTAPHIRNISWFVDPMFESHHGAVHNWVGGTMGNLSLSPLDPAFWMHHAFLDCLWEQMRYRQKQDDPSFNPVNDYPSDDIALGVGMQQPDDTALEDASSSYHHPFNPLNPLSPLRNIDALSTIYFDQFYTCQPSPVCTQQNPHCGSRYLFCDENTMRCVPKLLLGARCESFSASGPCLDGECCSDGVCKEHCGGADMSDRSHGGRLPPIYVPRQRPYY